MGAREPERLVAVHEAGHAVMAHRIGYRLRSLALRREGRTEGYVVHSYTTPQDIGWDPDWGAAEFWPHVLEEVRNQLMILFAGSIAVAKYTGRPFREVEGGGGDNADVVRHIWQLESLRRDLPGLAWVTDDYRPYLFPGSITAAAQLIGEPKIYAAVVAFADRLLREREREGTACTAFLESLGLPRGVLWYEVGSRTAVRETTA